MIFNFSEFFIGIVKIRRVIVATMIWILKILKQINLFLDLLINRLYFVFSRESLCIPFRSILFLQICNSRSDLSLVSTTLIIFNNCRRCSRSTHACSVLMCISEGIELISNFVLVLLLSPIAFQLILSLIISTVSLSFNHYSFYRWMSTFDFSKLLISLLSELL